MKNPVLTVTLLGLISFGASAAPYYDHDDNVSNRHASELRQKAFEGEPTYQVKVNPQLLVDRDNKPSTRRAEQLRLKAFDGEPTNQVNVNPQLREDRDNKPSTRHAEQLRLSAIEKSSLASI